MDQNAQVLINYMDSRDVGVAEKVFRFHMASHDDVIYMDYRLGRHDHIWN